MDYRVTVADVPARRTAVIAAVTTWPDFPPLWAGSFADLEAAHDAVVGWCAAQGHR